MSGASRVRVRPPPPKAQPPTRRAHKNPVPFLRSFVPARALFSWQRNRRSKTITTPKKGRRSIRRRHRHRATNPTLPPSTSPSPSPSPTEFGLPTKLNQRNKPTLSAVRPPHTSRDVVAADLQTAACLVPHGQRARGEG